MGQQQLTLIILGSIIAAVAFVAGLAMVNGYAYQSNKDAVARHLSFLGTNAQQWYKRSVKDGGPFFTGYAIPAGLDETPDGVFTITALSAGSVTITGMGTVTAGGATIRMQAIITPVAISITDIAPP